LLSCLHIIVEIEPGNRGILHFLLQLKSFERKKSSDKVSHGFAGPVLVNFFRDDLFAIVRLMFLDELSLQLFEVIARCGADRGISVLSYNFRFQSRMPNEWFVWGLDFLWDNLGLNDFILLWFNFSFWGPEQHQLFLPFSWFGGKSISRASVDRTKADKYFFWAAHYHTPVFSANHCFAALLLRVLSLLNKRFMNNCNIICELCSLKHVEILAS
jgi:hypothetical protein